MTYKNLYKTLYKHYNDVELRFLRILIKKKMFNNIINLQTVQKMNKKKVFISNGTLLFEREDDHDK